MKTRAGVFSVLCPRFGTVVLGKSRRYQERSEMKRFVELFLGSCLMLTLIAPAHAQGTTLVINDTVASERLQTKDGAVLVPITDVAKALGLVVVKTKTGYALVQPGGANAVGGLRGKIGQTLFDGKWRFTVQSMKEVPSYTLETKTATDYGVTSPVTDSDSKTFTPKEGNYLLVFHCEVKNGQKTPQQLWWSQPDVHTAIADADGQSYPPIITDIAAAAFQSKPLLPGARLEFNLVFCLPTGMKLKDLVFTARTISEKGNDYRIALTEGK